MGLMVFERVVLVSALMLTGWDYEFTLESFLYGADGAFGPWKIMAVFLAGLLFAQGFQAYKSLELKQATPFGFLFGACNIAMIGLLSFGLVINWAYFHPDQPGAQSVNSLPYHLDLAKFDANTAYERRSHDTDLGWVQVDDLTVMNSQIDLVIRQEPIHLNQTKELWRLNLLARNPDADLDFFQHAIYAKHYYDLEGNLLTIDAKPQWQRVREKLRTAGRKAWDGDGDVWRRFKQLEPNRPKPKPLTYEEILVLVEASWEGISLEEPELLEETQEPNSNPE